MYNLTPVTVHKQVRNDNMTWYSTFKIGSEYVLTKHDMNNHGGWIAWRNNLDELLKLIPQDADKVV